MRELQLLCLNKLQETEDHDRGSVARLIELITANGSWKVPIAVEHSTLAIMDGHHRFNAAKLMGLSRVPCMLMNYQTSGVSLKSWRDEYSITVEDIFYMIKKNKKYPLKTTRHLFDPSITEIDIPLSLLY
jgi:L-serine kinase (ADP)